VIFPFSSDDALLSDFGEAPFEVTAAVAEQAIEDGIARVEWKKEEVRERAKEMMWEPVYRDYVFDVDGEK